MDFLKVFNLLTLWERIIILFLCFHYYLPILTLWEHVFTLFCFIRWPRLIINIFAHWDYRSIPKPKNPTFTRQDVTVIIPTIEDDVENLRGPVESILACKLFKIILVTTTDRYTSFLKFAKSLKDSRIKIYSCGIANKRLQLREAIPKVKTKITVLVDDDVTWPKTILPWLLAPFEKEDIGSVGVCQRVKRLRTGPLTSICFNWLGGDYLERRNFEISASHYMDGGTSCMSGRTNAIRTKILQDPFFLDGFCKEHWGKYHLNADDDNFITRWLAFHRDQYYKDIRWKTWIQYEKECQIETTLENNILFLWQCLRWARSNWRSNYTTLFVDRDVWRTQPWSVYLVYTATFTSLGVVTDPLFFFLYSKASAQWDASTCYWGWVGAITLYLFSKIVKRIGLLRRHPLDIIFIPVSIIFGFIYGIIKITALITWNETSWGSRPDGGINNQSSSTSERPHQLYSSSCCRCMQYQISLVNMRRQTRGTVVMSGSVASTGKELWQSTLTIVEAWAGRG